MKRCAFCRLINGDTPADIVFEDTDVVVCLAVAPLNLGHALVMPREHYPSITEIPPRLAGHLTQVAGQTGTAAMRATGADGFNIVMATGACAGQAVSHLSLEVIPRHPTDGVVMPARSLSYDNEQEKETILHKMKRRLHG